MSTREHPQRLMAWVDQELEAGEAARVAEHLARCPRCREEVEGLRALHRDLAALPAPAAGDLWPDLSGRLRGGRPGRLVWAGYLAVLLVGVLVGSWVGGAGRTGGDANAQDLLAQSSLVDMPQDGVSRQWFAEVER